MSNSTNRSASATITAQILVPSHFSTTRFPLSTQKTVTKTASFFQAVVLKDGIKIHPETRDWGTEFAEIIAETTLEDRLIDGLYFDPVEVDGNYLLGIHKPLKTNFLSTIDPKANSISDVLPDDLKDRYAHSSAVMFTGYNHIFALALGHTHAPRHTSVEKFLNTYYPRTEGEHWVIEPFMDRAQLKQFREAKGAIDFSTKFTTKRDLLNEELPENSLTQFGDQIAAAIGSDVEIKISVALPPGYRNANSMKNLQLFTKRDLRITTGAGSNAKARTLISEGVEEELHLVAHKLAADFDLPQIDSERQQFSQLLQGLQSVRSEMDDRVKQLIVG